MTVLCTDTVESPLLNFWAGFGLWPYHLPPMVEDQEAALPGPALGVYPALKNGVSLVVIAELG